MNIWKVSLIDVGFSELGRNCVSCVVGYRDI